MLIKRKKRNFFKISNEILVVGIIVKIYVSDDDDNNNKWSKTSGHNHL